MAKIDMVQMNPNSKFFYFTVEGLEGRVTVKEDLKDKFFNLRPLKSLLGQEFVADGIDVVDNKLVIVDIDAFAKAYGLKQQTSILDFFNNLRKK